LYVIAQPDKQSIETLPTRRTSDLETLDKITDILNSPLQKGERNDAVIPFKEKLNRLGYGGIALSDKFGSHTEKRVEEFQNDHGLPVSGILEKNTQAKINEVYSSPIYQEGDRAPEIAELKQNGRESCRKRVETAEW